MLDSFAGLNKTSLPFLSVYSLWDDKGAYRFLREMTTECLIIVKWRPQAKFYQNDYLRLF